jgi:mediator of RNA polymerase II transcription subunit 16
MTNSLVLSLFPIFYNTTLAFCQSDGTIEFRQRSTLNVIAPDYNQNQVSSLSQAGFAFSNIEPSIHVALSANHCMAIAMQSDGEYKLQSMEYTLGSLKSIHDDPKNHAAIAALVLQHTAAANQYFTSDDILALLGTDISESTKRVFVSQAFHALSVNLDCVPDENYQNAMSLLTRSTQFIKCLSAQLYFGSTNSATGIARNLPGKLAWVVLNMRYATQIMTMMMRMHSQPLDKSPPRPDVAAYLLGLCRWMMHTMVWIIDELMSLGKALRKLPNAGSYDRDTLQARLDAQALPTIIILLSSFPRMMLKSWQQPLQWISRFAIALASSAPTPEMRAIYQPLQMAFVECPFDWRRFESLVAEANKTVQESYKRAGVSDAQRAAAEKDLMMGSVPDVLMPAARRLLGGFLFDAGGFLDRIDPARVMFADIRWLGLDSFARTREWQQTHIVDVCQKIILKAPKGAEEPEGPKLRRCTRCAALMDDVTHPTGSAGGQPANGPPGWTMGMSKHCVCQGGWLLERWPKGMMSV